MQPLKPYFLGLERPPHPRLTSCQKCFRTADIDIIGTTARHLTFFEMLGNFSVGDYFKQGAVEFAWELSLNAFGFDPEQIWITVFEGDKELGLGPDEEAIAAWEAVGVPRERIVLCPRSENFWQSGPTGPCGPCSELYFDRGLDFGSPADLPGEENERFLEYWNLVFMQYNQDPIGVLTPLPAQNIDTGLGLERMAAILQDKPSVWETAGFAPLIALGEELSGRRYGSDPETDRALRVLADHARGMTFLVADGVVPSNEGRGYILRRIMRRAIQRGRLLGIEDAFLPRFAERVRELMAPTYPELHEQREEIDLWLSGEEEAFGRTLERGTRLLEELVERARSSGEEGLGGEDVFKLEDTFGFPVDLTRELAEDAGLGVDVEGYEREREAARERSRAVGGPQVMQGPGLQLEGPPARFVGYETLETHTTVGAVAQDDDRVVVKLPESPFYAAGGGQVSDVGVVECEQGDCRARVVDVVKLGGGDDQALIVDVEQGALAPGERVVARVDRATRLATMANHTATHLLHAALRRRLGTHVRQAGSYVGPDKLRFDFTHGHPLTPEDKRDVEDQVNAWILDNSPVRAIQTTLDEAKSLGAMALFGEKYGDVVRMVEIGDGSYSRELCGGTHVRSTAEIGVFRITQETSSAANVRRIEAVTGPEAVQMLRRHDELDRVKPKLGEAAVVLGSAAEGKVAFVASVAPALVERGVHAGNIVKLAAQVTGGGGGGRDTMAQAGGRDPSKLDEALGVAREAIERALRS